MRLDFLNNGIPMDHATRLQKRTLIVATITAISVAGSLFITYLILALTGYQMLPIIFIIATIAPSIIAPVVCWSVVGLVIEVQKLEESHLRLATYDDLTGLLRRGPFLTQLAGVASVCQRNNLPLAVATLDLDKFKLINDHYGHGAGDEVLKSFADIVQRSVRAGDLTGRLGGEEFAVVLPGSTINDAALVLERIRLDTQHMVVDYLGNAIKVTVSAGLAGAAGNQLHNLEGLLKQSDDLLYQAKDRGRNQVVTDATQTEQEKITQESR